MDKSVINTFTLRCKCGERVVVGWHVVFRCANCKRGYRLVDNGCLRKYRPDERDPQAAEWEDVK